MTPNLYLLVILFLITISCIIGANFVLYAMIGEVNRKVQDDQRISYLWFYPAKYIRIRNEYRRLFPTGRLVTYYRALLWSGFAFLAAFAWKLRMFR